MFICVAERRPSGNLSRIDSCLLTSAMKMVKCVDKKPRWLTNVSWNSIVVKLSVENSGKSSKVFRPLKDFSASETPSDSGQISAGTPRQPHYSCFPLKRHSKSTIKHFSITFQVIVFIFPLILRLFLLIRENKLQITLVLLWNAYKYEFT